MGETPALAGKDWIDAALRKIDGAEKSTQEASGIAKQSAEQASLCNQAAKISAEVAESAKQATQQAASAAVEAAERAENVASGILPFVCNSFAGALKGQASGVSSVALNDVSSVEHTVSVKLASKNMIPFPYYFGGAGKSTTANGITFTIREDGGISRVGTATAFISYTILATGVELPLIAGKRYVVSKGCILNYLDENGESKYAFGSSVLWKEGYRVRTFYTQINEGQTVDDVIYPQLELGPSGTSQTDYSRHIPQDTEVVVTCGDQRVTTTLGAGAELVSASPDMSISVDHEGVVLEVQYNRDIGLALDELKTAIISLGGVL